MRVDQTGPGPATSRRTAPAVPRRCRPHGSPASPLSSSLFISGITGRNILYFRGRKLEGGLNQNTDKIEEEIKSW